MFLFFTFLTQYLWKCLKMLSKRFSLACLAIVPSKCASTTELPFLRILSFHLKFVLLIFFAFVGKTLQSTMYLASSVVHVNRISTEHLLLRVNKTFPSVNDYTKNWSKWSLLTSWVNILSHLHFYLFSKYLLGSIH